MINIKCFQPTAQPREVNNVSQPTRGRRSKMLAEYPEIGSTIRGDVCKLILKWIPYLANVMPRLNNS